jgi:glycosyltransferase involved in cell wall biosynthesis
MFVARNKIGKKLAKRRRRWLVADRLCRAIGPMKAPFDWLRALRIAADRRADFEAVGLGDGPLNDSFHLLMEELGLRKHVRAPGFVANRTTLLHELRRAHIFIFAPVTPESPRCLLEALVSGTPVVGYRSALCGGFDRRCWRWGLCPNGRLAGSRREDRRTLQKPGRIGRTNWQGGREWKTL